MTNNPMTNNQMTFVAFTGSLRKGSFNRLLLRAAVDVAPAGMAIDVHAIDEIPLFNEDIEDPVPAPVARLKDALAAADGLLLATPEYNAGIPGVTKNVVDWLSRPPGKSPLKGKPVGLLGASTGVLGTVRAQTHLRAAFAHNGGIVMPTPQVFVGQCREKFDAEGNLVDEKTRAFLTKYMQALAEFAARFR